MTYAAREGGVSADSRHDRPQGRLRAGGDRAAAGAARPRRPALRLKRSVDLFAARDGALYLLQSGMDDFEVTDPSAADRALLERLRDGFAEADELAGLAAPLGMNRDGVHQTLAVLEEHGLVERADAEPLLDDADRERYDRQLIYFADVAPAGLSAAEMQRRLLSSRVLLLGCGGLGSWTASALACAGVGALTLVDDDHVQLSNLNRQILFSESDIGEIKVDAARAALGRNNSRTAIATVCRRIRCPEDLGPLLEGVDLLISTADWPAYELPRWVNRACAAAGVPFITAGQFPPLVRIGPLMVPGTSACLECWERRLLREHPRFAEVTDHLDRSPSDAATLGAASGVVGSLLAMEAVHLLTGAMRPATLGRAHVLDLRSMQTTSEEIHPDPGCPLCGALPARET